MEKRGVGLILKQRFPGGELKEIELADVPAVRLGHEVEFFLRFRKGDIEALFPLAKPLQQELQREGGFADARVALHQIKAVAGKAAAQDIIETLDARRAARRRH